MTAIVFSLSVTTDEKTGDVLSVYFFIRKGSVHETQEYANGAAFADYNKQGELLGIELLAPCSVSIVDQLAANEPVTVRRQTKRFMKNSGPRQMIAV